MGQRRHIVCKGREDLPSSQKGAHMSKTSCTHWVLQVGMLKANSVYVLRESLKPAPVKLKLRDHKDLRFSPTTSAQLYSIRKPVPRVKFSCTTIAPIFKQVLPKIMKCQQR